MSHSVCVATWNLLSCRDPEHGQVNLDAVAAGIAALDCDVVALQEVDRCLARTGESDQLAELASRLGYTGVYAPALLGDPGGRWASAGDTDPGGPAYGVGVLTRRPPLSWKRLRLPGGGTGHHGRRARDHSPGWDAEPRVALQVELDVGGSHLWFTATHLSYMPWRGARQLRSLLAAARRRRPAVVAGDLNLPPWAVRRLAPRWRSAGGDATYPADNPRIQIDHILGAGVRVGPAHTRSLGVSDHIALVADVTLRL